MVTLAVTLEWTPPVHCGSENQKLLKCDRKAWSWREELNLQPVVYKLGQAESENTQEDARQGKIKEPDDSSS
jgi:hypothetical protein